MAAMEWPTLTNVNWFPGHMAKGMRKAIDKAKRCHCIIEVHDARVPFTGRNENLKFSNHKRLLVLNKVDLIDRRRELFSQLGDDPVIWANCKKQHHSSIPQILDTILDLTQEQHTTGKSVKVMVVGIPNVGKSSLINALRRLNIDGGKAAPIGALPGVTRSVSNVIKISVTPPVSLVDTPGIMIPNIRDTEAALKLAAIGTLKDHLVGEEVIAQYIMYTLNKFELYRYVEVYDLEGPCHNITDLLTSIGNRLKAYLKGGVINYERAANHFIKQFREGRFGVMTLDD